MHTLSGDFQRARICYLRINHEWSGQKGRAAGLCLALVGAALINSEPGAHAQQSPDAQQEPARAPSYGRGQERPGCRCADPEPPGRPPVFPRRRRAGPVAAGVAQFYRGILANRNNDAQKSIALLESLVESVDASGDLAHEKLLRKALAEDYLREGDWAKAGQSLPGAGGAVAASYQQTSGRNRDAAEDAAVGRGDPPMTVDPCEPFVMQVSMDPLGLTDIPVFVDAQPHSWMLDPTAPFNLIARSTAREVGLRISDDVVTIHTLTGKPMQVHATVIPRFTIGGRLTLHNVTAFVFDDADYYFPHTGYRVEGVLGYAALEALGSVKFTSDVTIAVQPEKNEPKLRTTQRTRWIRRARAFSWTATG